MLRFFQMVLILLVLAGCAIKPSIDDPKLSDRELDLVEFFEGRTTAHGQFQDVLGNVSRRFEVDIKGSWNGSELVLVEDFLYSDNTTEQRIWTLTPKGDGAWTGTAAGVIGEATGQIKGDMFYWTYTIDLPLPDGPMRVTFDDYMWSLSDKRVLNIAYMSKYGFPLGQVTIFFEKK